MSDNFENPNNSALAWSGISNDAHTKETAGCSPAGRSSNWTILPPHSTVHGQTIAEWTEDWWTTVMKSPAAHNILTDPSGANAHVNNYGPVFFVGGTSNGEPVERSFTVHSGQDLLIPIVNMFDTEGPNIGATIPSYGKDYVGEVNEVLDDWAKSLQSSAKTLTLTVDGKSVGNLSSYLERTDIFDMGIAHKHTVATDVYGFQQGTNMKITGAEGVWVDLHGLSKGEHTISFGGDVSMVHDQNGNELFDPLPVHVTDHILVV